MKGNNKVGSVLAAFEDTIAKNQEHLHEGGRSFLTAFAANSNTSKLKHRLSVKHNENVSIPDMRLSQHSSKAYAQKYTAIPPFESRRYEDQPSCTTTSTTDDESQGKSLQTNTLENQTCNHRQQKNHTLRKAASIVDDSSCKSKEIEIDPQQTATIQDILMNHSRYKRRENLKTPIASETNNKTNNAGITRSTSRQKEKSSLRKIAATIKRVNSSNSFREAAKVASTNEVSKYRKSSFSKTSSERKTNTTVKLSDHVNRTPPSSGKKYVDKSITSLPIAINATPATRQQSFSSLPIILPSSDPATRGIAVAARRNSILFNQSKFDGEYTDFVEKVSPEDDACDTIKPLKNANSENLEKSEQSIEPVIQTDVIACEYGSYNLLPDIEEKKSNTNTMRSVINIVSDIVDDVVRSIKPDVVEVDMEYGPHNMSPHVTKPNMNTFGIVSSMREGNKTLSDVEVDMEYGPHNMSSNTPLIASPVSGCENSIKSEASDLDSLCGTEATPKGIAKAARRSSVDLCRIAEYDELYKTSENISAPTGIAKAARSSSVEISTKVECNDIYNISNVTRTTSSIAKAARRSSVELSNRAEYDDLYSVSGTTSISDDSAFANTPDYGSIGSSKTDQQEQTETLNDKKNSRGRPKKTFSTLSMFSLDLYRCPKTPIGKDFGKVEEDLFESFSTVKEEVIFLPRRDEVVGILRMQPTTRNLTRHVRFADQQPGGGRRMSMDTCVKNDSLPVRPRRSNNFELDRLKNLRSRSSTEGKEPLKFMAILAATTIQAVVRRWIQWRRTRPLLLSRKIAWIEEKLKLELVTIQEEKWLRMEKIQSETIERERRLEAQVSLGEKLCDHLKRDSTLVRDQTIKLKEYSQILTKNNSHLDRSVRLHRDNFVTTNLVVELLREKSDSLLASSKSYASRIDKFQNKLELTRKRVELEFRDKARIRKTIKRILRLLKKKGFAIDPMITGISQFETTNRNTVRTPINFDDLERRGFDLVLSPHDDDMMSVYSDITTNTDQSSLAKGSRHQSNESTSSCLLETARSETSCLDELNRTHSSTKTYTKSCGNSFASYNGDNIFSGIGQVKSSHDSVSVNGNSFASYGAPAISLTKTTNNVDVTETNTSVEHTTLTTKNSSNGAAIPPRRKLSTNSMFDAIDEEVSFNEESQNS
jgi:hypothetical protein